MESLKWHKLHVYGKQQTSDSSWKFIKTENEQIKAVQDILMDRKLHETTKKCVEIVNSKRQLS